MSSSKVVVAASVRRRWRPKQYVLAGMAAIVAASAVVVVTSVILRPARISFSVTDARTVASNSSDPSPEGSLPPSPAPGTRTRRRIGPGAEFFFTLAVDNPSRRAAVRYSNVVVNLQVDRRRVERQVVQARVVGVDMPYEQPAANLTLMRVQGFLETELNTAYERAHGGRNPAGVKMTIIVVALVRFRVGLAFTRLYDIRIFCSPVNFFNATYYAAKVNCSA